MDRSDPAGSGLHRRRLRGASELAVRPGRFARVPPRHGRESPRSRSGAAGSRARGCRRTSSPRPSSSAPSRRRLCRRRCSRRSGRDWPEAMPRRRASAIVLAVLLLGVAIVYFRATPRELRRVALYHAVFTELLPNSADPADDLRRLALPETFARYSGTTAYDERAPLGDPAFREELDRLGYPALARIYLSHPDRAFSVLRRAAWKGARMRPPFSGTSRRTPADPSAPRVGDSRSGATSSSVSGPGRLRSGRRSSPAAPPRRSRAGVARRRAAASPASAFSRSARWPLWSSLSAPSPMRTSSSSATSMSSTP